MMDQVNKVEEEMHQKQNKIHLLNIKLAEKDKFISDMELQFSQNKHIANICSAESHSYQEKVELINQDWQLRLENKNQQIRSL